MCLSLSLLTTFSTQQPLHNQQQTSHAIDKCNKFTKQRLIAALHIDYLERVARVRLTHPKSMREYAMPTLTAEIRTLFDDQRVKCLSAINSVFVSLFLEVPQRWWNREQCRGLSEALDSLTGEIMGPPLGCRIEVFNDQLCGEVIELLPGQKAKIRQDDGALIECDVSFYCDCCRELGCVYIACMTRVSAARVSMNFFLV